MELIKDVYRDGLACLYNKNKGKGSYPESFSEENAEKVKRFHEKFDAYEETKLLRLNELSKIWGVKGIYVKDESTRFNLQAFKVLGGSYAVAKLICEKLRIEIDDVDFTTLKDMVKKEYGQVTFATATDGNHGRGIAWAARELGQKAVIYMPKGTAQSRVDHIEALGGEVHVTDLNYDDAVRLAFDIGEEKGWFVVQDTSWEGYMEIPTWIMQGYMTMGYEAAEQLQEYGVKKPTHVMLQAGVGAMAGGILGYYANRYKGDIPKTIIMEPNTAACIYKSAKINDGKPYEVTGDLDTIMAGLACGVPNLAGWDILRDFATAYVSCENHLSADGIRILANPVGEDEKIIAGESGSVGIGVLDKLLNSKELEDIKEKLGLNEKSEILIFSTEGATDPVNYREILWYGRYQSK